MRSLTSFLRGDAAPAAALLVLRVTFGLFLLAWAANKLINPGAAGGILRGYYGLEGVDQALGMALGGVQALLALAIIAGAWKTLSYGAGLAMHAASVAVTAKSVFLPFVEGSNILFVAGLPVLGAGIALFAMRRQDVLWAVHGGAPEVAPAMPAET